MGAFLLRSPCRVAIAEERDDTKTRVNSATRQLARGKTRLHLRLGASSSAAAAAAAAAVAAVM